MCIVECRVDTSPQHAGVKLGLKTRTAGAAGVVTAVPVAGLGKFSADSIVQRQRFAGRLSVRRH